MIVFAEQIAEIYSTSLPGDREKDHEAILAIVRSARRVSSLTLFSRSCYQITLPLRFRHDEWALLTNDASLIYRAQRCTKLRTVLSCWRCWFLARVRLTSPFSPCSSILDGLCVCLLPWKRDTEPQLLSLFRRFLIQVEESNSCSLLTRLLCLLAIMLPIARKVRRFSLLPN